MWGKPWRTSKAITKSLIGLPEFRQNPSRQLGWEHINLTGDYVGRQSQKLQEGKFRPLRPLPEA